jgi:hypothetical protein
MQYRINVDVSTWFKLRHNPIGERISSVLEEGSPAMLIGDSVALTTMDGSTMRAIEYIVVDLPVFVMPYDNMKQGVTMVRHSYYRERRCHTREMQTVC